MHRKFSILAAFAIVTTLAGCNWLSVASASRELAEQAEHVITPMPLSEPHEAILERSVLGTLAAFRPHDSQLAGMSNSAQDSRTLLTMERRPRNVLCGTAPAPRRHLQFCRWQP